MQDCLIIGGGAIGLSLAYELSTHGQAVLIVDRRSPGQEASWAGAGLLPPCLSRIGHPALDAFVEMSNGLHARWAEQLREQTAIDTEFRRSGALLLATTEKHRLELVETADHWHSRSIRLDQVDIEWIARHESALNRDTIFESYFAPDEVQLRNPRHLRALETACRQQGVRIVENCNIDGFERRDGRVVAAIAGSARFEAEQFCVCGGTWSSSLLEPLGVSVEVKPMRGQIVLLKSERPVLNHIVYDGPHYLVPRADGHTLVGSTVEDVGFDKRTTDEAISGMLDFARKIAPPLAGASVERAWAGLRPATSDGLPFLDRLPGIKNGYVAAGHFRCGLQLSTATAVLMRQLMTGETPAMDLRPFSVDRDLAIVS
ncbi:MAG: glycine oxidase ThiO [Pirellulales bacterium]|nr:glycine oxidase ThiO [Pirellulales bacterium]